jgi:hypothetical protein
MLLKYSVVVLFICFIMGACDKKVKKDVRDYTDAEIEKLYDEWEVCKPNFFIFF